MLALVLVFGLAACGKQPPPAAPQPPPPAAPAPPPPAPAPPPPPPASPAPAPLTEEQLFAQKSLQQLNDERPLADVFFDLDQSTIREDGRAALARNAEYLKRWSSTRINIEGHGDERGTAEYNLALGDRRAAAVRDYLASLGIGSDRMNTLSKGEEAPFCTESNETCWQQNRRGHFVFTAK